MLSICDVPRTALNVILWRLAVFSVARTVEKTFVNRSSRMHSGKRRIGALLCAASIVALAALPSQPAAAQAAPAFVMKMGTASINDQQHEWLKMYKAAVEHDSGGRIRIDIYPSAQLGSIPREIEDTQFGAIQGWVGPPEFLTGIDQRFEVLGIPGVFHNDAQMTKTLQDPQFATTFMNLAADKGIVGISLFLNGRQALVTRKAADHLADARGLKLRVTAGPVLENMTHSLGATPVPMSLDQVLPALQQGAIDGAITTLAVTTPQKYYTVAPYAMPIPSFVGDITVISKTWLTSLPLDLQKIVVEDGLRVGRAIVPFTTTYLKLQETTWTNNGGHIGRWSPPEEKQLETSFAGIGRDVTSTNPALSALYALLVSTAGKYR
jgi:TRAP-type C4-dicarboxylate transport system substrate-binding protein